jgi:hypothetical protein
MIFYPDFMNVMVRKKKGSPPLNSSTPRTFAFKIPSEANTTIKVSELVDLGTVLKTSFRTPEVVTRKDLKG